MINTSDEIQGEKGLAVKGGAERGDSHVTGSANESEAVREKPG